MKTIIELEKDIVNITSLINSEYPELSKYISEMPIDNSEHDKIDANNLKEYFNSLVDILDEYSKTHVFEKFPKD